MLKSFMIIASSLLLGSSAFASNAESVPGEFVVKLKPGFQAIEFLSEDTDVVERLNSELLLVKRSVVELSAIAISDIEAIEGVEYAEPNYIYKVIGQESEERTIPNDTEFKNLWGLYNTGQQIKGKTGVAGVDIDAPKAWSIQTGSKEVVVAVIDTGVDPKIDDLKDNMWVNDAELNGQPGIDDDGNGFIDDIHGYDFVNNDGDPTDDHSHGTHCAGTIGGKGNDTNGVVGVAWNVSIMGVKFLSKRGSGTLANAVKSIDYAREAGAHIMSNSWGGGGFSQALKEAIERASEAGILFTAAAGNHRANNDLRPSYPASYEVPNVMSIAALDNKGELANFSCWGPTSVDVAAPGVDVLSTTINGLKYFSGTSMATPHVSGIAALLMSQNKDMTMLEVKERIINRAKPLKSLRGKVLSGGLASAYYALADLAPPVDPNDPVNWESVTVSASTPHPYNNKEEVRLVLRQAGAKKIAVHFENFETERWRDRVYIYDKDGKEVQKLHGKLGNVWSQPIDGDEIVVVLKADASINKYGFDITRLAFQ